MDKMKILVIDDLPRNQQSARDQLGADHDLIVCSSIISIYEEYPYKNGKHMFDIIMSSMFSPEDSLGFLEYAPNIPAENQLPFAINMAMKHAVREAEHDLLDGSFSHQYTLGLVNAKRRNVYDMALIFLDDYQIDGVATDIKNWTITLNQLLHAFL
jgi:hypothetical protein